MRNYYPKKEELEEKIKALEDKVKDNERKVKSLEEKVEEFIEFTKENRKTDSQLSLMWGIVTVIIAAAAFAISLYFGLR